MIRIIGKIPPPIGGVTIHVSRLVDLLNYYNCPMTFENLNIIALISIIFKKASVYPIHLHSSNVNVRLFFAIACRLRGIALISTIHGDFGRFNKFKNYIDRLALQLTSTPVVINQGSYDLAILINNNTQLISAFIPPIKDEVLPLHIKDLILGIDRSKILVCTNAFDLSYDKNGKEIYGIIDLLKRFKLNSKVKLIISDPSGNYYNHVQNKHDYLLGVPLWLNEQHSFFEVLKLTDVYIRNTTTDGDSLSVREALSLGLNVYATDCVDRPKGVTEYGQLNNLQVNKPKKVKQNVNLDLLFEKYQQLYKLP